MKPNVICHMATSIDGRTLPSRWRPEREGGTRLFERVHEELGGDAWLIGRITGQELAKKDSYADRTNETFPREPWFARRDATAYGSVLDAHGKIAWGRSDIGGDPIVGRSRRARLGRAPGGPSRGWRFLCLRRRDEVRSRSRPSKL